MTVTRVPPEAVRDLGQEVQRRGVRPVQVLEHHRQRAGRDQRVAHLRERGEPGGGRRGRLDVGFVSDLDPGPPQRGAPGPQRRRRLRRAVPADDRRSRGVPDRLVDESGLADAGRAADQQDPAG